jgi:hypothetical protein
VHCSGDVVQLHPIPAIPVAVSPLGSESATVTVPTEGDPPTLLTEMLYVAPVWPCMKFPMWVFAIVRSGPAAIVVGSLAVSFDVLISPPPDTATLFVTLEDALFATLAVRVIEE